MLADGAPECMACPACKINHACTDAAKKSATMAVLSDCFHHVDATWQLGYLPRNIWQRAVAAIATATTALQKIEKGPVMHMTKTHKKRPIEPPVSLGDSPVG